MRLKSLLLLPVLLLSACYPQVPTTTVEDIQNGKDIYSQELSWQACDSGFECSKMVVPLNWLEPEGEFLEISLIRKAGSEKLPELVVNPGGPGASGVNFVKDSFEQIGTGHLHRH